MGGRAGQENERMIETFGGMVNERSRDRLEPARRQGIWKVDQAADVEEQSGPLGERVWGKLVAEQAAEAEAMVKAPERGEEIVWRDIPEPDSEVIPLATKNA